MSHCDMLEILTSVFILSLSIIIYFLSLKLKLLNIDLYLVISKWMLATKYEITRDLLTQMLSNYVILSLFDDKFSKLNQINHLVMQRFGYN